MPSVPVDQARIALLREAGVSVSEADVQRVSLSVRSSLAALQAAVSGTLFDTEPQTFDVVLRRLSNGVGRG